jgi:hypothetical protein
MCNAEWCAISQYSQRLSRIYYVRESGRVDDLNYLLLRSGRRLQAEHAQSDTPC